MAAGSSNDLCRALFLALAFAGLLMTNCVALTAAAVPHVIGTLLMPLVNPYLAIQDTSA